ncbi:hypothetical protein JOB18_031522 [Solea senegalensis]|uniref:Uncharacterized protein n=1 Tax=Solea senegalensis TaxID=28829 RepID=A0AAV6S326_SOLSE|nr:hypothetical protein JOB18_031522 [Solea senegalensis]
MQAAVQPMDLVAGSRSSFRGYAYHHHYYYVIIKKSISNCINLCICCWSPSLSSVSTSSPSCPFSPPIFCPPPLRCPPFFLSPQPVEADDRTSLSLVLSEISSC